MYLDKDTEIKMLEPKPPPEFSEMVSQLGRIINIYETIMKAWATPSWVYVSKNIEVDRGGIGGIPTPKPIKPLNCEGK